MRPGERVVLQELEPLIARLHERGYTVIGPVVRDQAIVYDEPPSAFDLPAGWTDEQDAGRYRLSRRADDALFGYSVGPQSWKRFLHPSALRLLSVRRKQDGCPLEDGDGVIPLCAFLGARACELAAIAIQGHERGKPGQDPGRCGPRGAGELPGGLAGRAQGTVRPGAGRRLDHDAARRRAHPPGAQGLARAGDDRRLRHGGRHPGLRNFGDVRDFVAAVYPTPEYISTLETSTPIAQHVPVDFELRGCPISKDQLLEVIAAILAGRRPNVPSYSVCQECKREGRVCVMVAHGTPCLGPVTQAGCGALCPAYLRGCYGCFGPMESANSASLGRCWQAAGVAREDVQRAFRTFNAGAPAFQEASGAHEP